MSGVLYNILRHAEKYEDMTHTWGKKESVETYLGKNPDIDIARQNF